MKIVSVKDLKENNVVNFGKGVVKIIRIKENNVIAIPYSKVKDSVFVSKSDYNAFIKKFSKKFSFLKSDQKVKLYGTHLTNLEKDLKKNKIEVKKKKEKANYLNNLKISNELKVELEKAFKTVIEEWENNFDKAVKNRLDKLEKQGKFYNAEYCDLTMSKISKIGIKKLGEDGWHYCFSYDKAEEQIFVFMRVNSK